MSARVFLPWAVVAASGLVACIGDDTSFDVGGGADASLLDAPVAVNTRPPGCPDPGGDAPATLECTGLYADVASKTVAAGVRAYAPAVPLWSDGAGKGRWIALPPEGTIDATDANEWRFPVGTRVWKEFAVGGKRVETRFFQKLSSALWVHATYRWSADETSTARSYGGDLPDVSLSNGKPYHVPTPAECDECHKGRTDRVLGFEAVGLGLPGATGLTLAQLASEGLLSPAPARTTLAIAADPKGDVAPAVAWLHVNCGVACHNGNSNAVAYPTGFRMRLDPAQLDGVRPASSYDVYSTGVGVAAKSAAWAGTPRIAAGAPDESLVVQLVSARNDDFSGQMPPLVSKVVDDADVARVRAWIEALPHAPPVDAGADASPVDAGEDAPLDAASLDAGGDAMDSGDAADASEPRDAGRDATQPLDAGTDATVDGAARDASSDAPGAGG